MRLARVEAARFGRLEDATLGPLGDGLTVVLGPNEAGKSTYTALVRYLLYGFPTEKSVSERPYLSDAGNREGRLVFESAEGEWVVERTAGPKGGPVSVRTLRGPDRPTLVDELTRGVSEQAFKVVFGFGLREMAEIERLRGTDDDIIARLYAAGAGLATSPQEVRAAIEAQADALYRPRGSKPLINALLAEARELRSRVSGLEHEAERLIEDRARLAELAGTLEHARLARDEAAALHRTLLAEESALAGFEDTVRVADEELLVARREARDAAAAVDAIDVDEQVLAASAEIDALAGELSAYRQRLETVRELEERSAALESEAQRSLGETGLAPEAAAVVDVSPETRAGVERWRERLLTAEQAARAAAEKREEALEEARVATGAAEAAAATPGPSATVGGATVVPWAVAVLGLSLAGAGIAFGQWIAAGAGVVLAVFAVVVAVRGRTGEVPLSADGARLADRAADLSARADKAVLAAERSGREVAGLRDEWAGWRAARGLAEVSEPAAVVRVLELVADALRAREERASTDERLARERASTDGFRERVAEVAQTLGVAVGPAAHDVEVAVVRLGERLAEARTAADAARRAREQAEAAAARLTDVETRREHAFAQARELIERLDIPGGLAELSAAVQRAEDDALAAQEVWGTLTTEHASLETRIGEREREDTMGSLRMELASANERISGHAERYAVLAVASRLLNRAQERYERERQPDVVREAERIFAAITDGAYPRLTVPLGATAMEVFDTTTRSKDTGLLSTGTAEQLYLALRLALIGQLGQTGAALPVLMDDVFANFDPERKAGAAEAVAGLARTRQVVVFTCHPETAEVLAAAEPDLQTLTLDRC